MSRWGTALRAEARAGRGLDGFEECFHPLHGGAEILRAERCELLVGMQFEAGHQFQTAPAFHLFWGSHLPRFGRVAGNDRDPLEEQPLQLIVAPPLHQTRDLRRWNPLPDELADDQGLQVLAEAVDATAPDPLRGIDAAEGLVMAERARREFLAGP